LDGFLQTILGAVSAIFGGFGGAWFIRWRDNERAKREHDAEVAGLIVVVLSELAENSVNLTLRIEAKQWLGRYETFDRAYRDAEPLFGRELPSDALEELFKAYAPLRSDSWLYRQDLTAADRVVEPFVIEPQKAEDLRSRFAAAALMLRRERDKRDSRFHA
jgi:hypothetical protein